MLKLKKLEAKRAQEAPKVESKSPSSSFAKALIQKQLTEFNEDQEFQKMGIKLEFPDKNDIMNFNALIVPDNGWYKGAHVRFSLHFPPNYNMEPPKVFCETMILHPNIEYDGRVCLNILKEDWTPANTICSVLLGLLFLLVCPNADDPLNIPVAEFMRKNEAEFIRQVRITLNGGTYDGRKFPRLL